MSCGSQCGCLCIHPVEPAVNEGRRLARRPAGAARARRLAPSPSRLKSPYFASEAIGCSGLDELGAAIFAQHEPAGVLHDRLTQELTVTDGGASLRLDLPFAERGDVSLKKIGLELVVRVDGHKRTIVLPGALAGFKPISATLEAGSLVVGFQDG